MKDSSSSRVGEVPYTSLEPARKAVVVLFLAATGWYLAWRLGSFNPHALRFSRLIYAAELYGVATTVMHLFMTWRLTERTPPAPPEGATVDVFVTTINEPAALLRKTLLAVLRMEYPHRTYLLDDGRREEMEELARSLGCGYLTRSGNADAKAGNLNNALGQTTGEFIAVFDADHAPKKNFLSRTLGYFADEKTAFVQTPQDFYNLDSYQHHRKRKKAVAWHEQSVFFRVIQRGKDYWNAAFFCGSCAVIRRSALERIGGFATGTVTEDLHTSVRFHKAGFRSVYHAEPLAFGLAPSGVASFLKQRIRWGQGAMQVWRKEGIFFCRGLTLAQRINYVASSVTYFDGWHKGLFYITPAVVLVTGVMPLAALGRPFALHFVPYFILNFLVFEEVNRGYGRSIVIEQYNMARFAALAYATLGLFKKVIGFSVTPKGGVTGRYHLHLAPQALVLAGNLAAIAVGIVLFHKGHHLPINAVIANAAWSLVNAALAVCVILFTAGHSRFTRGDYRFCMPLPVEAIFPGGVRCLGTVDDISAAGFRLYALLPEGVAEGTAFAGEILLPDGRVRFSARVKGLIYGSDGQERFVKALGCRFERFSAGDRDRLEIFLYGSDAQLNVHGLGEIIHTPLRKVTRTLKRELGERKGATTWNAAYCRTAGGGASGVVSAGSGGKREVLSLAPLPEGTRLVVERYGRLGVSFHRGVLRFRHEIETPLSPLYLYELAEEKGGGGREAAPTAWVPRTAAAS